MKGLVMGLAGKVALVTGASSGMGKATAWLLAQEGADVIVNYYQSEKEARSLVEEIKSLGRKALAVKADVAVKSQVTAMVTAGLKEMGKIDILVNNAGTLVARSPLVTMPEEVWDRALGVNLKGVFLCCQAVARGMIERGSGNIVNIASVGVFTGGGGGGSHYVAAKGGVVALTRALARELAPHGIRVNAIAPGIIDTPFHAKFSRPETMEERVKELPLKRAGRPEEIARAVLFLVEDGCAYITGQTIILDGGMSFGP